MSKSSNDSSVCRMEHVAPRSDKLILVNSENRPVGTEEKLRTHLLGLRHRAFSIFLQDEEGRILLQQRHPEKYHSGGLWANTCCGHPNFGEPTLRAARRRLFEELGLNAELKLAFHTSYRAKVANDMEENEYVYVYVGRLSAAPRPHPKEISDLKYLTIAQLADRLIYDPSQYSVWLHHYIRNHTHELTLALGRA